MAHNRSIRESSSEFVLTDQLAQQLAPPDAGPVHRPGSRIGPGLGRGQIEPSVGPGPVVVSGVGQGK